MKRALLFLSLAAFVLLGVVGCDNTNWNPNPPAGQAQVAFLQTNLPQAANSAGGEVKLMVMNADGSEPLELGQANFAAAHLSRNGTDLVVSLYDTELNEMRILSTHLGGDLIVDITPVGAISPQMPELSPDGSTVYFTETGTTPWEIWSVNANLSGTAGTNLNSAHEYCMHEMTVAPNGKVYFVGESETTPDEGLFVMNGDGSNPASVIIVNDPTVTIYHPSVTADGTKLVFEVETEGTSDVYTANIDGSNVTPITTGGNNGDPLVVGDKILFVTYRNHIAQVFSMNLDGSNQTELTDVAAASWFGDYFYN